MLTLFLKVLDKGYILYDRSFFSKCAPISRFRETYSLIHDREGKSMFEAVKLAFELMFRYDIQPAIIAACKLQDELEEYIDCLNNNDLKNFSKYEIKYQINPF